MKEQIIRVVILFVGLLIAHFGVWGSVKRKIRYFIWFKKI